jgi:ribosomal protein L23
MASKQLYHFTRGQKEIFLYLFLTSSPVPYPQLTRYCRPSFTLTLIRSPFLPPTYAKFLVPLNLNKLDIRDYLFHSYNVRVLRVRSFIEQQKVQTNNKGQKFRPKAVKKMCVEMDKPFVWPEEPEDFTAYVCVLAVIGIG